MNGHAGANDDDVLVSERGNGLAKAVVGVRVLVVEERDLDQWDGERVLLGAEGDVKAGEDAVIEAAFEALGLDPGAGEQGENS